MHANCPACGTRPDVQAYVAWGDGRQRLDKAPWICAQCGALALIDLATGSILATREADWEPVRLKNPALWKAIVRQRATIMRGRKDTP